MHSFLVWRLDEESGYIPWLEMNLDPSKFSLYCMQLASYDKKVCWRAALLAAVSAP